MNQLAEWQHQLDLAALRAAVRNFGAFADARLFPLLEDLFAPRVYVDYQSLNGQAPASMDAASLMEQWSGVLPGFALTYHDISEVSVDLRGDSAAAGALVCADHFVAGLFWRVKGRYEFVFRRRGSGWKIETLRFLLLEEEGTREVFGPAIQTAREHA